MTTNKIRKYFGLALSAVSLPFVLVVINPFISLRKFPFVPLDPFVWGYFCTLLGVGIGLFMTRNHVESGAIIKRVMKYLTYHVIFLPFIGAYLGWGFCFLGKNIPYPAQSWFNSSIIGFLIGISGDSFFGVLRNCISNILKAAESITK